MIARPFIRVNSGVVFFTKDWKKMQFRSNLIRFSEPIRTLIQNDRRHNALHSPNRGMRTFCVTATLVFFFRAFAQGDALGNFQKDFSQRLSPCLATKSSIT